MPAAEHINRHTDEVQHHRRNVQHLVRPVTPAGKKSVEVSELLLRPKINAAFTRIAMRELDNGNALRPEKQQDRNDPQPDRDAAVCRDRRHHVQIKDRDDEKQHQVPASQDTLEMRLIGGIARARQGDSSNRRRARAPAPHNPHKRLVRNDRR